MKILIKTSKGKITAELNNIETAKKIYNSLPIKASANVWGEEIYFEIPVKMQLEENAKQEMEIGDLAYWPLGNAFCIFFGKTPASINSEPRAISKVTFLGKVDNIKIFKSARDGEDIVIEKI